MLEDIFRIPIKRAQDKIKKEYDKNGFTPEVLDAQISLNKIRHALDIPDEDELVYGEFVQ